jgi:PAS domain S-box-containing protein
MHQGLLGFGVQRKELFDGNHSAPSPYRRIVQVALALLKFCKDSVDLTPASMLSTAEILPAEDVVCVRPALDEPESALLLRLTNLVERVFQVRVAYIAVLGGDLRVTTRIGSGHEHWDFLASLPLARGVAQPLIWPDPVGDLRFLASTPLRSSESMCLGLLVIADVLPRPGFSGRELELLAEFAALLAGQMELRMMASEANETELWLREAEARFRNIANAAPVLIIYSSTDGASSFVNKTWLDFTGREFEDELGDGFEDVFHPDHRAAVMQVYWEAFAERKPLAMEFPMRRHDGIYRWMQVRGRPRFLPDGRFTGYIGCFTDITDQRSATLDALRQKRCLAAVSEATGVGWQILDTDGYPEPGNGQFIGEACDATEEGRAAIRQAISTRTKSYAGAWTFAPVLSSDGELLAVAAVQREGWLKQ